MLELTIKFEETDKEAGVSISSYAMKESEIDDLEDHIIEWLE